MPSIESNKPYLKSAFYHFIVLTMLTPIQKQITSTLTAFGKIGKFTISVADVVYLKGDGNYTHIHLASGRSILSARTLLLFEEIPGLVRIHKSYVLNSAYIKHLQVINPKEAFVVMKSGAKFAVSRRRIDFVKEHIRLFGVS
jgi:two-component system LytT family response regulator